MFRHFVDGHDGLHRWWSFLNSIYFRLFSAMRSGSSVIIHVKCVVFLKKPKWLDQIKVANFLNDAKMRETFHVSNYHFIQMFLFLSCNVICMQQLKTTKFYCCGENKTFFSLATIINSILIAELLQIALTMRKWRSNKVFWLLGKSDYLCKISMKLEEIFSSNSIIVKN